MKDIIFIFFDKYYRKDELMTLLTIKYKKKFNLFFNRLYEDVMYYRVSNLKDGTHFYMQLQVDHFCLTYISQENYDLFYDNLKKYIMKGLK